MEGWIQRAEPRHSRTRVRKGVDKRPLWVFLGIAAIVVKTASAQDPYFIEELYSNTIFIFIRSLFDHTIGALNFPVLYLVIPYMLFKIFKVYTRGIALRGGCILRFFNFLYSTAAVILWIVFWFTALWGLNYNRIDTHERLALNYSTEITNAELFQEVQQRAEELIPLRESLKTNAQDFQNEDLPADIEDIIRDNVMETMALLDYRPVGKVRIRNLKPKGILLRFGTAGFYFPFTGECNIDSGLHPLQKPFTMAHEMAHGYGVGNEGTCNFIAYLACMRSENSMVRYSGLLGFWRYLAGNYRSNNNDIYTEYREDLHQGIVRDLDGINANNELYPDIMPWLREAAYDSYLKSQGEADGIASYGRVVELVLELENQYPQHPVFGK